MRAGADHVVAEWTARATHPETRKHLEWDGMDLVLIRGGRICRNAVYSSASLRAGHKLSAPRTGRRGRG